ncbi:MAG: iron-sulfur cluster assembly accessory protein [Nanoarchaeota archaeon]|nr:iron-sulfur cluster assembly accessory protein [Nanoarchaeota archaeon]
MITITKKAQEKIEHHKQKKKYLRLTITGEGCNGTTYDLQFTDKKKPTEEEQQGIITILINKKEKEQLEGTTIDYIKEGTMEGFYINNPHQEQKNCHGCNCGH